MSSPSSSAPSSPDKKREEDDHAAVIDYRMRRSSISSAAASAAARLVNYNKPQGEQKKPKQSAGSGKDMVDTVLHDSHDHDDAHTGFHEDDCHDLVHAGEKPRAEPQETLLNPVLENSAAKKSISTAGQAGLCLLLILIGTYEVLLKKKAKVVAKLPDQADFDINSIIIWNSVASIILGAVLTLRYKTSDQLLNKDSLKMFVVFLPPGLIFGACSAMQFMILDYIPPDVFKVLEQMRLLVVAIMSRAMLGKRQTWLSWIILVVICFCCCLYCFISQTAPVAKTHSELLQFALNATHGKYAVALKGQDGLSGALFPDDIVVDGVTNGENLRKLIASNQKVRTLKQIALKEELTEEMHKLVQDLNDFEKDDESNYVMGLLLTFVFIMLMCLAGVYCEKMMKQYSTCPFYIQKVYMEIPTMAFGMFNSAFLGKYLVKEGFQKPSQAQPFFENPFAGWGNIFVILCFVFFMAKSWLSGIIVKMLSSVAKQLCSIVSVVCCYFMIQIHFCDFGTHTPMSFFCPDGIYNTSPHIAVADLAVLVTVMTYVLSQNQARDLQALHKGRWRRASFGWYRGAARDGRSPTS